MKFISLLTIFILVFSVLGLGNISSSATDSISFFVLPTYDINSRSQLQAILENTSANAYFYIEESYWLKQSDQRKAELEAGVVNLASEFDSKIHPKLRELFGSEWKPGIDGDNKITVFLTELKPEVNGYFRKLDEFSRSEIAVSNQREMVYINVLGFSNGLASAYLAHEFSHLVTYYQKEKLRGVKEDVWLEEAMAEYAPTAAGLNDVYQGSYLQNRVNDFLNSPIESLTEWNGTKYDFASVSLFIHFLTDHYGTGILTKIIQNDKIGIEAVSQALKDLGRIADFSEVFTNWTIANYINNATSDYDRKYSYLNSSLSYARFHIPALLTYKIFPTTEMNLGLSSRDWSVKWYKFIPGDLGAVSSKDTLKIGFKSIDQNYNFKLPYIITDKFGEIKIKSAVLDANGTATIYIPNFGRDAISVVIIPSSQLKLKDFSVSDPSYGFLITSSIVENVNANYPEGSIIRADRDYRVYIVKEKYKRWIQSGEIFDFYGHLSWDKIINVIQEEINFYEDAWLVRAQGDFKVYELNGDGTKHWLNMTAQQFEMSGRKWNMIYEINFKELDWYRLGADVMFVS